MCTSQTAQNDESPQESICDVKEKNLAKILDLYPNVHQMYEILGWGGGGGELEVFRFGMQYLKTLPPPPGLELLKENFDLLSFSTSKHPALQDWNFAFAFEFGFEQVRPPQPQSPY